MPKLGSVTFTGSSGKKYKFNAYPINTEFEAFGAVYLFTKRYKNSSGDYNHIDIYIGQTKNISERFENHHAMPCIKRNDANCICIYNESSESKRLDIEKDLIDNYNPPCNTE